MKLEALHKRESARNGCFRVISTMLNSLDRVVAMLLLVQMGLGGIGKAPAQEVGLKQFRMEQRTAKERLSSKAADEQRVDNCKVPLELRGPKPRSDHCVDDVSTTSKR